MKRFILSQKTTRLKAKKWIKSPKRHFQLLEVMVAIFLILLCATPSLQIFTNIYKEQAKVVRVNQRDHLAHLVHAQVVEQLYKRQIPLEEIKEGKRFNFEEPDLIKKLNESGYEAFYQFAIIQPVTEKGQENAKEFLCALLITLSDKTQSKKGQSTEKKSLSDEPKETFYDYLVFISRELKGKTEQLKQNKTEEANKEEADKENGHPVEKDNSKPDQKSAKEMIDKMKQLHLQPAVKVDS